MSEPTPDNNIDTADVSATDSGFEPITSQDELDKYTKDRVARAEKRLREKYAPDLAKAAEWDALKASSMSDADRIKTLETELAAVHRNAELKELRHMVAEAKDVPVEFITGETQEEMEASAEKLKAYSQRLTEAKPPRPAKGLRSGATGSDQRMNKQEQAVAAIRAYRSG